MDSSDSFTMKEILNLHFSDMKEDLKEIKSDGKETKSHAAKTNGRVTVLEQWAKDAQKILESTSSSISNYKLDRTRIWTAISVLTFCGGVIITLSIMAINSKIKEAYSSPEAKQIIKATLVEALEERANVEAIK